MSQNQRSYYPVQAYAWNMQQLYPQYDFQYSCCTTPSMQHSGTGTYIYVFPPLPGSNLGTSYINQNYASASNVPAQCTPSGQTCSVQSEASTQDTRSPEVSVTGDVTVHVTGGSRQRERPLQSCKPLTSYVALIFRAIANSREKKATLREIIEYIEVRFAYFRSHKKWHGSIRHNLTVNDCFVKTACRFGNKGCLWAIDPAFENMFDNGSFLRRRYRFKEGSDSYKKAKLGKAANQLRRKELKTSSAKSAPMTASLEPRMTSSSYPVHTSTDVKPNVEFGSDSYKKAKLVNTAKQLRQKDSKTSSAESAPMTSSLEPRMPSSFCPVHTSTDVKPSVEFGSDSYKKAKLVNSAKEFRPHDSKTSSAESAPMASSLEPGMTSSFCPVHTSTDVKPNVGFSSFSDVKPDLGFPRFPEVKPDMDHSNFSDVKPDVELSHLPDVKPDVDILVDRVVPQLARTFI